MHTNNDLMNLLELYRLRHRDLVRAAEHDRLVRDAHRSASRRGYATWLSRVMALFFLG